MKKNQLLIGISVIAVILALFAFRPSDQSDKYLYVRVFESPGTFYKSSVTISDGETIIKTVKLKAMIPRNIKENILTIAKTLNDIKSQGYKITSSSSGGNQIFIQTDYVFEKE